MHKIFIVLRQWVARRPPRDCSADDPLEHMSPAELADLPPWHPRAERRDP